MSRNTQYKFVPTDPEDIVTELTALYEAIFDTTVQPASPDQLFIRYVAAIIIQERVQNNYTGNQNIPSRAEGKNLDALAELTYSKERPAAKAATCTMRFSISEAQKSAVLIPAGTRITDTNKTLVWVTLEDNYIPIGETYIDVENVTCQTAGTAGNGYTPGQINKLVDVFDFYTSCQNVTTSGGGSDAPDDDEYYELMRSSMDAYSTAGARGGYVYWAKQESTEIADVIATSPTPGVVKLYVLMKDGTAAGEEIKAKVLAACSADERRPLTDYVSVEDPESVDYRIRFTYYIQEGGTESAEALEAAVREKVDQYVTWQCAKLGRDINPSRLISMLMETGIKRVDLTEPAFISLKDGSGTDTPQLARLDGTPEIINGGYEDE